MLKKNKPRSVSVVIKGAYGCGNFGDDALMVAAHKIIKIIFNSENCLFVCKESKYIEKILPGNDVISEDSFAAKYASVFVYGGGTQFYSFPLTRPKGFFSLLNRILVNLLSPIQLLKKITCKLIYSLFINKRQQILALGVGLGPFNKNYKYKYKIKKLFTNMSYIAVRDELSYELCKKWNCKNVFLRSDLCFYPGIWNQSTSQITQNQSQSKLNKIGVIVRDWPHTKEGDSYFDSLFKVVNVLRSGGKDVTFILFDNNKIGDWYNILQDKNEEIVCWNPDSFSIEEFLEVLASFDFFVTSRYHGAIFASLLLKPVVCIEIEQKLRIVSELLRDGSRLWSFPFKPIECLNHIEYLEKNYSTAVESLKKVTSEQENLIKIMVSEIQRNMKITPLWLRNKY